MSTATERPAPEYHVLPCIVDGKRQYILVRKADDCGLLIGPNVAALVVAGERMAGRVGAVEVPL